MVEHISSLNKQYADCKEIKADILAFSAERKAAAANPEKEDNEVCGLIYFPVHYFYDNLFICIC